MSNKEKYEGSVKSGVDLDQILVEEVGGFNTYQLRTMLFVALVAIFSAFTLTEYIFTTARINTRCLIPECDDADPEFSPKWILSAVPESGSSFDNCRRFVNRTSPVSVVDDEYCPASSFDPEVTVECEAYVYENTDTVVYNLDMGCDEWRRSLFGSMRTLGTLVALPITGFISDRWGRKTSLIFNAINSAWIGPTRYSVGSYAGYMISQFVEAAVGSGSFSCGYIIAIEIVAPKYRVIAGATANSCFALGQVIIGFIAWGVPQWQNLTLALYIPQLVSLLYFWITVESIRWLMSRGRYDESVKILKDMARVNKRQLSQKSVDGLKCMAEQVKRENAMEKNDKAKEPWLVTVVFKSRPLLVRGLVLPVWWLTTTFIYYGLSINAVNMLGNRYLNFVMVSAVEIPGYWASVFLLTRIGRRFVLIAGFWLCALCQLAYMFLINENIFWLSLLIYLIGKFCIAGVLTANYIYSSEVYPTKYRHSLVSFASMIGRIGAIVAPLTPALAETVWPQLPFVLFGGFAFVSGFLGFLMPETRGTKLPDTIEEAEQLGRKVEDRSP